MNKIFRMISGLFSSSLLWGGLASIGFYAFVHNTSKEGEFFYRYFANHWVLYVETVMFFVGVAELLLRAFDLSEQRSRLKKRLLGEMPAESRPATEASQLIATIDALPHSRKQGYFPNRLRSALEIIGRQGSVDTLEDELKYLSETDAGKAHAAYALLRFIIWGIPILGFLGTVIGITIAIASLNPQALETSLDEVTSGLGVAFDTTALALTLSMTLMFGQYLVDRYEQLLLSAVDGCMIDELHGRFISSETVRDPHLAAVQRMSELVVLRTEGLVQQQVELWQQSMDAAERRWNELSNVAARNLEQSLAEAVDRNVQLHAERLVAIESEAAQLHRKQWSRLHKALSRTAVATQSQAGELSRQTDTLLRITDASNQVVKLEKSLNQSLSSLAGSQHLQETLMNLSATLGLLNARLGVLGPVGSHVELHDGSAGQPVPAPHLRGEAKIKDKNVGKIA